VPPGKGAPPPRPPSEGATDAQGLYVEAAASVVAIISPSSRKGDSGGSVAKDQKVHDSPVAWPLRGKATGYNKSTKMPEVKCTVVGSGGLR